MTVLGPLIAFVSTVAIGYLVIVAAAAVAGALARGGRRERAMDAYDALAVSRFTIPVSVIVPAGADGAALDRSLRSLLAQKYPELEVIVVASGLSEEALDRLKRAWDLSPKEVFYRRHLVTGPVHRIHDSGVDGRLMLVEKPDTGAADALNCGVSLARYRYVVTVPADVEGDEDALLRLITPALRDPAAVLAVTSYVERRGHEAGQDTWVRASDDYQRLSSVRSWMASRLAWTQLRCGLPPREAVIAWRRDAVIDLDGFSSVAADPELDLLVRLQTSQGTASAGRVVRTSEVFGHAAPMSVAEHARLTTRRQRAVVQAIRTFWRSPGVASRLTLMLVLGIEVMTPAAQLLVLTVATVGAIGGWVAWTSPIYAMLMLGFGYAVVSASALLLRGGTPDAPVGKDLVRLLVRAPLELVVYRPVLTLSRLK